LLTIVIKEIVMPTQRAQKIAVICHGAYVLHAQVRWQDDAGAEHETGWSGDVPVGQAWAVDMSTQKGITTGRKMWPKISIVAGGDAEGDKVEYAPNGHTITYEAKGTTWIGRRLEKL
jgi:hypothetical protein